MTDIIVASISAVALIVVAVINVGLRRRVKAIQGQVQNDHSTNLREELDERHGETRGWFEGMRRDIEDARRDIEDARRDIGGMRSELRGVRQDHRTLSKRVHTIEQKDKP